MVKANWILVSAMQGGILKTFKKPLPLIGNKGKCVKEKQLVVHHLQKSKSEKFRELRFDAETRDRGRTSC